jgi:hypothetical protein
MRLARYPHNWSSASTTAVRSAWPPIGRLAEREGAGGLTDLHSNTRGQFTMHFSTRRSAAVCAAAVTLVLASASPGAARTAINPNDVNVFAISPNLSYIAEWSKATGQWTVVGDTFAATGLVVGDAGVFACTPTAIYRYNGTPNQWTQVGGAGDQFVEAGNNLYGTGPNGAYVAQWNGLGKGWTIIGGPAQTIEAGGAGLVATSLDGSSTNLYDGAPNQWTYIDDGKSDYFVGSTGIFKAGPDLIPYQWVGPGDNWQEIGGQVDLLFAGADGLYADQTGLNDDIEQYSGTPNQWTTIGGPGFDFVTSSNTLYGLGPDGAYVAVWSGTPGVWTQIGGPAHIIAAGY